MQMIELIGYIGATLTTASFLPQAIQTIKTRDTSGISFWMYLMFVTGVVFWLVYGILLENKTIIIANIVTLILASSVLVIKVHNCRKR
jgi:MtN3 and saliva related transmembrane protein